MALIVEDGSGSPDSNAYVDIPYVSGYLLGEQLEAWEALEEPEQEAAIIRATRYIDSLEFYGTRKTLEQGLSWPRSNVTYEGYEIIGVPVSVKKATAETVGLVLDGAEFFSDEADMEVASERVDTIAVSYRTRQVGEKKEATNFAVLHKLFTGFKNTDFGSVGLGIARVERV
jgi:hypothetical protein